MQGLASWFLLIDMFRNFDEASFDRRDFHFLCLGQGQTEESGGVIQLVRQSDLAWLVAPFQSLEFLYRR